MNLKSFKNYVEVRKNKKFGRKYIRDHFSKYDIQIRTLDRWLERLELVNHLDRQKGCGRPVIIATKPNITFLKKKFDHRHGRSQKQVAKKLGCSQQYDSLILKKYTDIK